MIFIRENLPDRTIHHLSGGRFHSVQPIERSDLNYTVSACHKDCCGAFSGLKFGPVNRANDCVLNTAMESELFRTFIAIEGRPYFGSLSLENAEVFFLASGSIVDLNANAEDGNITNWFSQLLPPVMLFRHVFRDACWHTNRHFASLIIDDPLLRKNYGFFNYERVLKLMDRYGFHTNISFIPYNYCRSSPAVARIIRERPDRFSLSIHGLEHTAAEFGETDKFKLDDMVKNAISKMNVHERKTGIRHGKVMVFPQGIFSVNAMRALKDNNFSAAVNTNSYPHKENTCLRIRDLIQPAITRYGGFPLFLRKYLVSFTSLDVAFNVFFGKPILVVDHHVLFKDIRPLEEFIACVKSLVPDIQWSNLQTIIENSYLQRRAADGRLYILSYAGHGRIQNNSHEPLYCTVIKSDYGPIERAQVFVNGIPCSDIQVEDDHLCISFCIDPNEEVTFSVMYDNDLLSSNLKNSFRRRLRVSIRRRASEFRDEYLSKYPKLYQVTRSMYDRFIKKTN